MRSLLRKIFGLLVLFPIGVIPSVLFFVWIERNATLPIIPLELGWPVVRLYDWPLAALAIWDLLLLFIFGAIHSGLAQPAAKQLLERITGPDLVRLVYVAITGLSLWGVMALWQNTGIVIWSLPVSPATINTLSMMIYWSCLAVSGAMVARHGALEFLGVENQSKTGKLILTGLYARVRHPIYSFTLLAFTLAPQMTLDRSLVIAGLGTYLFFAIPLEEKKLVTLFGVAYVRYRTRVPAVIPSLCRN